jgi:hypothetical protein
MTWNRIVGLLIAGAVTLGLAACSDAGNLATLSPTAGPDVRSRAPASDVAPMAMRQAEAASPPASEKRLAITHAFTLRAASREIEALQRKHLDECVKLGCTVLNTYLDRSNEGRITARISVRIAPESYDAFAKLLASPPAEIVTHSESAEDKTVAILDVEKRLEVKTALRDRLAAMLRDPGTKSAADLAMIEKELAQVQGDIETIVAQRDYLRTITQTARVDISYFGIAAQAGGLDLSPVQRAVNGIGRTVIESAAALISFVAAALPWLPFIALVIWGVRRGVRRWRSRRAVA